MSEAEMRLAALMRKSQQGDSAAYQALLRELGVLMRRFIRSAIRTAQFGDDGSAEELVQEVLLALHLKRHNYDPSQRFLPWLYAIARHKTVDRLRLKGAQRRLIENLTATSAIDGGGPETSPEDAHDAAIVVSAALETLPQNQRKVLELTKLEGLSVTEAAAKTGLTESNVKVLTHRALKALKRHLSGGSDED